MHIINHTVDHPISLTIAADHRLSTTDYLNDQIWELKIGGNEPPSISLETTFGLRARLCRIFPRFIHNEQVITDPQQFTHPVKIRRYYPNYIELTFRLFSNINVVLEYWVPGSQLVAGRVKMINRGHDAFNVQLEWAELLLSSPDGHRMTVNEIGMNTLLIGKTSNISPLLFVTGGALAGKSPYPSLRLNFDLAPRGEKISQWVHATLKDVNSSYDAAKEMVSRKWDTEIAHVSRVNARTIEIHTGSREWDEAFHQSQTICSQLFLNAVQSSNAASFVTTRKSDQGYSMVGDGSDYNHLWDGQTAIETHYLLNLLLPSFPELVKGLLENFLATQSDSGELDGKPGLAGQQSHLLATPLLTDIVRRLYEIDEDIDYLRNTFPKLLSFFLSWFYAAHDRDGDLIPEWDRKIQTGFDDHPFFSQDHPWSSGVEISTVECTDLSSYLFRDCTGLIKVAEALGETETIKQLLPYADRLRARIEQSWSDENACYMHNDRDSHIASSNVNIGDMINPGVLEINQDYNPPVRPLFHMELQAEITQSINIFIHGTGISGTHRVENITPSRIRRFAHIAFATSEYVYSSIERIVIDGLRQGDRVRVESVNLTDLDQAQLLPIWAGIPSFEQAKIFINLTIMNKRKFLATYGLKSWVDNSGIKGSMKIDVGTHNPWMDLILRGLVQYGERKKAAELFSRYMESVTQALQKETSLYPSCNPVTGTPKGISNSTTSLVPIGCFLDILGVKIYNPGKVEISGLNPFPWPVTVKFKGLTVIKQEKKTMVIFPDGRSTTINNDQTSLVSNWVTSKNE